MTPPGFMALTRLLSLIPKEAEIISKVVRNNRSDYLSLRHLVKAGLVDKIDAPARDRYGEPKHVHTKYLYRISKKGAKIRKMYQTVSEALYSASPFAYNCKDCGYRTDSHVEFQYHSCHLDVGKEGTRRE